MSETSRVLITGADGFIGSHLTELLVREGFNVRALTMYNSFNTWGWLDQISGDIKGQFEVVSGDIRDPHGVKNIVKNCNAVMHLAALIAIPYSYHSPDSYVETNVRGTLNLLQAARELGIEKFIHTSTSEVYGTAQYVPITEEHPLRGQSPYSATKIAADQLAYSFNASFELPVTILRPFNTYGPRQSARAVIPTIITQISNGMSEISLGKTTPTRDFNYVSDTVRAFLCALRTPGGNGDVINIGSNFEVSIGETAEMIATLMGRKISIISEEARLRPEKSEVERLWADNSKAKQIINWEPTYAGKSGFEKGLTETIAWFSISSNLERYKHVMYNL
jgi:dTDP-glucose 4,6-dehydratase